MGGSVGGGGAGETTASWSRFQGLPLLLSRAGGSSLHCPGVLQASQTRVPSVGVRPPEQELPCSMRACWMPGQAWSRAPGLLGQRQAALGMRKQQQGRPPGPPCPLSPEAQFQGAPEDNGE